MAFEIRVPSSGESVVEATVGRWYKQPGDVVSADEPVVDLETDKVNIEVQAGTSGVLERILRQTGETVGINDVLATVATNGAGASVATGGSRAASSAEPAPLPSAVSAASTSTAASASSPTVETAQSTTPVETGVPSGGASNVASVASTASNASNEKARRNATPTAEEMMRLHGLEPSNLKGTGAGGKITIEDVQNHVATINMVTKSGTTPTPAPRVETGTGGNGTQTPTPSPQPSAPNPLLSEDRREVVEPMSRLRKTIARNLVEGLHNAAMLTTFNEVDMTAVMEVRKRRKDAFKEKHGVNLGFMSFFTKAVIGALKAYPYLNAEIRGEDIVKKNYYDIGIAVGTDKGLVVPVVRNADRLTFAEIEKQIGDLAGKARTGKLTLPELVGGTFTITNGGVYGSLMSTPILNAPQVGILGMHKIEERAVVVNSQIVIRPMMYLALSYDHRIVDGSEAVRFLVRVKELLEDPETLLLEG